MIKYWKIGLAGDGICLKYVVFKTNKKEKAKKFAFKKFGLEKFLYFCACSEDELEIYRDTGGKVYNLMRKVKKGEK